MTARHGTARHGTTRHDTARHGTTRHGTTRHDTARHGTARQQFTSLLSEKCVLQIIRGLFEKASANEILSSCMLAAIEGFNQ
jgi:hypothetical protein